jgi:glycosyltransferase involved in cell wall biosynthesis
VSFTPRISVLIPTYNRADSVLETLSAITAQTYAPFEIVIADDGSTDETVNMLSGLQLDNLKVILLQHSGLPAVARNAALEASSGDWVAFCDSDDIWEANRLHAQVSQRSGGVRAMCSNAWIDDGTTEVRLMFQNPPTTLSLENLLKSNQIVNSSVLVERNLLMEVGGIPTSPNLRAVEDYATWLRMSSITNFQFISEPLITYRENSVGSIRSEQEFSRVLNQAYAWIDFLAWMRSRGSPLYKSEIAIRVMLPRLIAKNARKMLR